MKRKHYTGSTYHEECPCGSGLSLGNCPCRKRFVRDKVTGKWNETPKINVPSDGKGEG